MKKFFILAFMASTFGCVDTTHDRAGGAGSHGSLSPRQMAPLVPAGEAQDFAVPERLVAFSE